MSQAQIDANRANAQKSTGPATPAGKARASMNALKTGIFAESEVIPTEKPEELVQLINEWNAAHPAVTPEIREALDTIVHASWRKRRLHRGEAQLYNHILQNLPAPDSQNPIGQTLDQADVKLHRVERMYDATDRRYNRNLDKLRILESELPPSPEASQPEPEPEPEPAPAPVATPQPVEDKTTKDPIGFVPSTGPEGFKTADEFRAFYSLRPGHPVDPYECPACKTRGRIGFQCGYEPKRRKTYADDTEESQND